MRKQPLIKLPFSSSYADVFKTAVIFVKSTLGLLDVIGFIFVVQKLLCFCFYNPDSVQSLLVKKLYIVYCLKPAYICFLSMTQIMVVVIQSEISPT